MAIGATVCDFFLTELHLITQTMDTARDFINDKLNKTRKSEGQLDETTKDSGEDTLNVDDRVFTDDPAVLEDSRPSSHMGQLGRQNLDNNMTQK